MTKANERHVWLVAPDLKDRQAYYADDLASGLALVADGHKRRRGPYTASNEWLRQLVPAFAGRRRELLSFHSFEILAIAPELKTYIPERIETLTSAASHNERVRFYAGVQTLRMAHGLTDFYIRCAELEGPITLIVENAHACDSLDAEFLSVLLRRAEPSKVKVIVSSPPAIQPGKLQDAIRLYATRVAAPSRRRDSVTLPADRLVAEYFESECTTECEQLQAAYSSLPEEKRKSLHDSRADELALLDEQSLRIGAILYHLEKGSSPAKALEALLDAIDYCSGMGFYEAVIDLGRRGWTYTDWESMVKQRWTLANLMALAYISLDRMDDARDLYEAVLSNTSDTMMHMGCYYGLSMLYTRYYDEKDYEIARSYIERSIACAAQLDDERERSFHTVFNQNGLALIEMKIGHLDAALEIVAQGRELLNRVLEPKEHMLLRTVLLNNQANLLAAKKDWNGAIDILSRVIDQDPYYADYYFNRGNYYSYCGRMDEALADYDLAIRYGPPLPAVYYNRAGVLNRLGETDRAIADYSCLLELEPDHLDGMLNRATLYYESGRLEDARQDTLRGLKFDEGNAELLCTLGLIEMAEGNGDDALRALSRALEADPELTEALMNRAVLYYERHEPDLAIEDLNQALIRQENATIYYNRAWVYESLGQWELAISDYRRAMTFDDADIQDIYYRLGFCCFQAADHAAAREHWIRHLSFGDSPNTENIFGQMPELVHLTHSPTSS
ncbi:tetratricopeptide repeat protein [Cohnella panacarvi]|uniref:tetratricopeptide repeat protein n=1 Tax=Cohnella panacarvi TaxID=400776 RepID=UPI00047CE674|nr:tetratricopeptide repeat protein [Cohnella panacarvi]